ncbi:hypothetical protein EM846_19000, partial [Escherichia coli]|nr:hypothetical protein [Escherichia coli]
MTFVVRSLANGKMILLKPKPPMLFWLKYGRRAWRCLLTICCAQTLMTLSVTLLPSFAKEAT